LEVFEQLPGAIIHVLRLQKRVVHLEVRFLGRRRPVSQEYGGEVKSGIERLFPSDAGQVVKRSQIGNLLWNWASLSRRVNLLY
jgi:hypothetical protein